MHRHIGIYPGTFDPVHEGHIAFAQAAKKIFHLDKVIFLPEDTPRRKQGVTSIEKRRTLLETKIEKDKSLEVLTLSSSPFSVRRTLPELHQKLPGSKFILLIGSDVALHLPDWQDIEQLLADASLLIALREGSTKEEIEEALAKLEEKSEIPVRYTLIDSPKPTLRSSSIRNTV